MLNRYSFEDLKAKIEQLLSLIDYDSEKYSLKITSSNSSEDKKFIIIDIKYENVKIICFNYFVSNVINPDGSRTIKGAFTVRLLNDADWYNGSAETIHVDEFFRCGCKNNQSLLLDDVLNKVLPLSDASKVYQIKTDLEKEGFDNLEIKFDTLRKRYIVIGDLSEILGLVDDDNLEDEEDFWFLYKYMSLNTYFSMLMNKTFIRRVAFFLKKLQTTSIILYKT